MLWLDHAIVMVYNSNHGNIYTYSCHPHLCCHTPQLGKPSHMEQLISETRKIVGFVVLITTGLVLRTINSIKGHSPALGQDLGDHSWVNKPSLH